ncbi:FAD-binding oxidoreductase [Chloroflexota bacterium]
MALSKDVCQELEDIVGADNISQEPAILDSYAFQWAAELDRPDLSKFMERPVAVIVPGSTEEVSAIVKICNKYKLKVHPHSTGWGRQSGALAENVVQLDLRRMDRILEVDEQNMFVVVEPYVIVRQLQAELMKLGLNCHMIGAGANCSVLALNIGLGGMGPDSISMGHGDQNLLGLEWVMPTGDILRTGSLGSGDGWFCGTGPGPEVRGLIRGLTGAAGGLGVFTKAAFKVYRWPGPPELPVQGTIPSYRTLVPENFRSYTVAFPDWEACIDSYYKLYDAEIGYIAHRQFNKWGGDLGPAIIKLYTDPTKTLDDLPEMLKDPEIQKLTEEMRISYQLVLAGNSSRDIDYQDKVLDEILAETGGHKVQAMLDPLMEAWSFLYMVELHTKNLNFVFGGYVSSLTFCGTPDFVKMTIETSKQLQREHQSKGYLGVDAGDDRMMGAITTIGGGGAVGLEQFNYYDPSSQESKKLMQELLYRGLEISKEKAWPPGKLGLHLAALPKEVKQKICAVRPDVYELQRKIREAFDPNEVGDGSFICLEKPEE